MKGKSRIRGGVLCVDRGRLLVVRLLDPVTRKWYTFPPGGERKRGETCSDAARRETLEEAGYTVVLDESVFFIVVARVVWAGETKTYYTRYFPAVLAEFDRKPVCESRKYVRSAWISLENLNTSGLSLHLRNLLARAAGERETKSEMLTNERERRALALWRYGRSTT